MFQAEWWGGLNGGFAYMQNVRPGAWGCRAGNMAGCNCLAATQPAWPISLKTDAHGLANACRHADGPVTWMYREATQITLRWMDDGAFLKGMGIPPERICVDDDQVGQGLGSGPFYGLAGLNSGCKLPVFLFPLSFKILYNDAFHSTVVGNLDAAESPGHQQECGQLAKSLLLACRPELGHRSARMQAGRPVYPNFVHICWPANKTGGPARNLTRGQAWRW